MTEIPHAALDRFLARLDSGPGYAVAKQPDLWGNLRRGGDWDLVVGDVARARELLVQEVGAPRRTVRRSYVLATFFDFGEIDLLPRIEWKGVELVATSRVLARAVRAPDAGWPVACLAHQAVTAWIYPMLAYGSFNSRYVDLVVRAAAEDGSELEAVLAGVFGRDAGPVVGAARAADPKRITSLVPRLRRAARREAFARRPASTLRAMSTFVVSEVALRLLSSSRADGA